MSMTNAAPSHAQLQRILRLATRAPSAGNMQPWRFVWNRDILGIRYASASEPTALNHEERVTAMTLGGLLECLSLAATVEGFEAVVSLNSLPSPDGMLARARFRPRAGEPEPLSHAIAGRCTDRRDFRGGSLSDTVFADIRRECDQFPECALHLLASDRYPPDLLDYIGATERFFWKYEPVQQQVMKVVRWSPEEAASKRDGVLWRSLGLSYAAARVLQFTSSFTVQRLLNRLGFTRAVDRRTRSALLTAAGLGLITIRATTFPALVAAGRLHTRSWLRLQAAGYALQPFTAASLYAAEAESGALPEEWPADQRAMFAAGSGVLRRAFGLPADQSPVWLLRTGRSPGPLERELYTFRYDLDNVLSVEP